MSHFESLKETGEILGSLSAMPREMALFSNNEISSHPWNNEICALQLPVSDHIHLNPVS